MKISSTVTDTFFGQFCGGEAWPAFELRYISRPRSTFLTQTGNFVMTAGDGVNIIRVWSAGQFGFIKTWKCF
jgi:hypothetical protein